MLIHEMKYLRVILLLAVLLLSIQSIARAQAPVEQKLDPDRKESLSVPDLAEIVPLATELEGRLAANEVAVAEMLNVTEYEKSYEGFKSSLAALRSQLQRLKDSKDFRYKRLVRIREMTRKEERLFDEIGRPLSDAIRQLQAMRKEWLTDKEQWLTWQSYLKEGGSGLDQLTKVFQKVDATVDKALTLIHKQLGILLKAQEKTGDIRKKIDTLAAELDGLILHKRRDALLVSSPTMFSSQYFSQFKGAWAAAPVSLQGIPWSGGRFWESYGWIVLVQILFSLLITIAVFKNRRVLGQSERWSFMAERYISTGLFLGYMMTMLVYEYEGAPTMWRLANLFIAAISFVRISERLNASSWKRHFVYGLIFFFIINRLADVLSFPIPLFRLCTLPMALAGLIFCLRWTKESIRQKDPDLYPRLLRLFSIFFVVVMVVEISGKSLLALYLFDSLIRSLSVVLVFVLFMYMMNGGVEWLFSASFLRRSMAAKSDETAAITRRVAHFIDAVFSMLVMLPVVLMIWGVYESLELAMKGMLTLGFNLGSQRISFGLVLVSAAILYGSYLISWIMQKLLMDEVLGGKGVEKGVRLSIGRLVHYVIIFIGFLLAISILGFEITKITILLSALGVGIGFGLQGIVNNFVSGLILLFERPVRVGDTVEINGIWAEIARIGIRATRVQTFDQADLIIPNADLINNQVINWTLSNRKVRLRIAVGVAYGSDVGRVMETLSACAKDNDMVTAYPAPQVLFLRFGESSLDFELRAHVWNSDQRLEARSDLHQEIDRRFREAKIEISFPQRDLRLRSVDESTLFKHREATA